jgi:hypothetical protein
LAETPKNENLLIAACHFWSNGANAFLFVHGPMSPTLADVYMMTGLKTIGHVYPFNCRGSSKQTRVKTGVGYTSYIQKHMSDDSITDVEYRAFLNMWLCRFIFCGKANEPTLNHIVMAEELAAGTVIPLGKYLLGSVYHMLHQTTYRCILTKRSLVSMVLGGSFRCGCNYTCIGLLALISTIGNFLQPTTRMGKNRSTKAAKLMEKLLPLYQSTKTLVSSLSSFSKVSPTPSGSHTQTMII